MCSASKKLRRVNGSLIGGIILLNIMLLSSSIIKDPSLNIKPSEVNQGSFEHLLTSEILPKANYSAIITEPGYNLGILSVAGLSFDEEGFIFLGDFQSDAVYGKLFDDLNDGALNITYNRTRFLGTIKPAYLNGYSSSQINSDVITVKLNESISVEFNRSIPVSEKVETYMVYGPRLYPCILNDLYIQEKGSNTIVNVGEGNYSVDEYNFLVFEYYDFFKAEQGRFDMHIIWEYNLSISDWGIRQLSNSEEMTARKKTNNITANYNYNLNIQGLKFNETIYGTYPFEDHQKLADNLRVILQITPPDKEDLKNYQLKIGNTRISDQAIEGYLLSDNKTLSMNITVNDLDVNFNFTTDFVVKFQHAVQNNWAIDKLVSNKTNRERIYFPKIIEGPRKLSLRNVRFFEPTISIDQIVSNTSLFGRGVSIYDANVTEIKEEIKNSLIFTENVTKKKGLEVYVPYMVYGETCPFTFRYRTKENLNILIADNINVPLSNVRIQLYYYGARYGTLIAANSTQPHAPYYTDEDGRLDINNVPNGNYTLEVYQGNVLIGNSRISAYATQNYVYLREVPHFPIWILVFGCINGLLLALGIVFYLNYKKTSRK